MVEQSDFDYRLLRQTIPTPGKKWSFLTAWSFMPGRPADENEGQIDIRMDLRDHG